MYQKEIEDLKNALQQSPENSFLRMMLIKKMFPYDEYTDDCEEHLQLLLKGDSSNHEAKEMLAQIYFNKGKVSATIIILEELSNTVGLSPKSKILLAKSYLKEGEYEQALAIYKIVLLEYPELADDDLDKAFRTSTVQPEDHDDAGDFLEKPNITFADVGGLFNIKKEIDLKIIKPLSNAELYAAYGKKIGGGILLYGPPGCGKTFLSKATAGEIDAGFINVGLNDILDMWLGGSEKNLSKIFQKARSHTPCVVFFDEIDALAAKRSDMVRSAGKGVINQFLNELDGVAHDNEGILIIGATNTPWHLDTAFRRPGRFDRIIFVPPPDLDSRKEILKLKLEHKPTSNIDIAKVAKKANHYSGADIDAIIDIAVEGKLEQALVTGVPKPLETKDLLEAIKKHRASTIDWFNTAKNYAMFANKSGLYDDVMDYIKKM